MPQCISSTRTDDCRCVAAGTCMTAQHQSTQIDLIRSSTLIMTLVRSVTLPAHSCLSLLRRHRRTGDIVALSPESRTALSEQKFRSTIVDYS